MQEDRILYPQVPFRNIPEGTSSSAYVEELVAFLEKYLPAFPMDGKLSNRMSENELTEFLYRHLTRKAKFNSENIEYPFVFQPEKQQIEKNRKGHPKRIDLATRLNTYQIDLEVIYCIEAKKLPTPGRGREKEYVFGKGGAIERFKNEVHGLDDDGNLLEHNGIVAYLTDGSFGSWLGIINSWIREASWDESEMLKPITIQEIAKLSSSHNRKSGVILLLTHFWVKIKGKP